MATLYRDEHFDLFLLRPEHVEAAARCIFEQFYAEEPMVLALKPAPEAFLEFLRGLVRHCMAQDLAIGAFHRKDGTLAGVALSEDYASEAEASPEGECVAPVGAFLEQMRERYGREHPFGSNEVLHVVMGAAFPQYRGLGFSRGALRASLQAGQRRGFRRVVMECASRPSQRLAMKSRPPLYQYKYSDFEFQGRKVFQTIETPESCMFYDGPIEAPRLFEA